MEYIYRRRYSVPAVIGTFWFLVALDSIIVWNPLGPTFRVLAFFAMAYATLLTKNIVTSRYSYYIFWFGTAFIIWVTLAMSRTITQGISHMIDFLSLLFVVFWSKEELLNCYRIIRLVAIFFAIGGAIVSILTLTGLISIVPYYVLPPREALHVALGYDYHVYGVFATLHDTYNTLAPRACGMMREPGHLAIILGFIYLIDRYRGKKINMWIVLCGILTFSSNIYLIIAITELPKLFTRRGFKIIKYSLIVSLLLVGIYYALPSNVRTQINYLAYERNLEVIIETLSTSSSVTSGLDERASQSSIFIYENLSYSDFLMGGVKYDTAESLADYRGLILQIGLIGVILSILTYFMTTIGARRTLQVSLLLVLILVIAHRSWMFRAPYLYFLSFLAVSITPLVQEEKASLYLLKKG